MDDSDDFEEPKQQRTKIPLIERSMKDSEVFSSARFFDLLSEDEANNKDGKFKVKKCDLKGFDFRPSKEILVSVLTTDEIRAEIKFKRKLAKLYSVFKGLNGRQFIVLCQSGNDPNHHRCYSKMQEFAQRELNLAVIPIGEPRKHLSRLIFQFAASAKKPNPFKCGLNAAGAGAACSVVGTLKTIPGVSEKGAQLLAVNFRSIQAVSRASEADLTSVVGTACATNIKYFFTS